MHRWGTLCSFWGVCESKHVRFCVHVCVCTSMRTHVYVCVCVCGRTSLHAHVYVSE